MIFKESHLEDPIYNAALDLIERELKIAHANQKIDSENLEQYKNVTREIIYLTPKQDLGHATKVLYDSIQKNLLGMEEVMGLPQRYFAPAIYNGIIDEVSCFNKISADESKKYLQNLGITKESVINWMKKGGFKKEDLPDKRVWEMIGSVADEDFVDPFLNLPYPVYVQGKKESEKRRN
ncbi:MAG: hypothetical protein J7L45_00130 [Candidatus Aenigmarchaeota archaeon]|nr:hypothetical protein [Candidatus Aenigmarchaeota archaeon]